MLNQKKGGFPMDKRIIIYVLTVFLATSMVFLGGGGGGGFI